MMYRHKYIRTTITHFLFLVLTVGLYAQSSHLMIDTESSVIQWTASKVTGRHTGMLQLAEGYVDFDGDIIRGGRFVFDMRSIENHDITAGEWKARFEKHIKSKDFFDVENYPVTVFDVITADISRQALPGEIVYQVTGDLMIKGITHVVTFDAIVDFSSEAAVAKGEIIVDRTKYNISYKSGKIYENLGDQMIHDEFSISFNVTTK